MKDIRVHAHEKGGGSAPLFGSNAKRYQEGCEHAYARVICKSISGDFQISIGSTTDQFFPSLFQYIFRRMSVNATFIRKTNTSVAYNLSDN
jgi:hypothetical protein